MEVITLQPELYTTLAKDAQQQSRTVNDIVNEAVEYYLHVQQQNKLDQEIIAYEMLHPTLKQKHLGQWIAVHNQEMIDYDNDHVALYRRIREKYGRTAILLRQVKEYPTEEIWIRTPSTGKTPQ